ncbi:unnamed protein product [Rhizoctonia solani]|nr:unnamed protein product [Rhizoctonia solani]
MRFLSYFSSLVVAFLSSGDDPMRDFIQRQYPLAKQGILDNIGSRGAYAKYAKPGVVVSSPSTEPVDYKHTFIRDSALVYKVLIDIWADGRDDSLLPGIYDWVASQGRLQKTPNLTGNLTTGGLGETGFNIDESVYTGPGGRPQHDNAAIRSSSMIDFANGLFSRNGRTGHRYVENTIWPIVVLDLDYVAHNWNVTGFNLWEEVVGSCHFTVAAQIRGLKQGAELAKVLGKQDKYTFWNEQADNALCFFQDFWDPAQSVIISNINCNGPCRDTVDVGSVFTAIRQFDPEAGCDNETFQPCSEMALGNLKAVVDSMRGIYPINEGRGDSDPIAIGRFTNDSYVGGHPWFLTTFAAAEQLYGAIYQWRRVGKITITSLSLPFFQQLLPRAQTGAFKRGQTEYNEIMESVLTYADGFSLINAEYIPSDGSMSEREPPTHDKILEVIEAIRDGLNVNYEDFQTILSMEKSPACRNLYLLLSTPDDTFIGLFPACVNLLRVYCNAKGNGILDHAYGFLCLRVMSLVAQLSMLAYNEWKESKWFEPFYLATTELPEGQSVHSILDQHMEQLFDWAKELGPKDRDVILFGVVYNSEARKVVCLPHTGGCSIPDAEFIVEKLWSARDKFLLAARWATHLFPRMGVMLDMMRALFAAPHLDASIPMSTWTISDDDPTWVHFLDVVTRYSLCCDEFEESRTALMLRKFPKAAQEAFSRNSSISPVDELDATQVVCRKSWAYNF